MIEKSVIRISAFTSLGSRLHSGSRAEAHKSTCHSVPVDASGSDLRHDAELLHHKLYYAASKFASAETLCEPSVSYRASLQPAIQHKLRRCDDRLQLAAVGIQSLSRPFGALRCFFPRHAATWTLRRAM